MEATLLPASPTSPTTRAARRPASRLVVPVHYSAWLRGDLGDAVLRLLRRSLGPLPGLRLPRLIRGILVEADEEPGVLVESALRAVRELEASLEAAYPVLHHEMGPLWTGTLQAVFTEGPAGPGVSG